MGNDRLEYEKMGWGVSKPEGKDGKKSPRPIIIGEKINETLSPLKRTPGFIGSIPKNCIFQLELFKIIKKGLDRTPHHISFELDDTFRSIPGQTSISMLISIPSIQALDGGSNSLWMLCRVATY